MNTTSSKSSGARRILIVEDNQFTGTLYRKVLEKEGFEVVHITAGKEAIAAIRDQKFDLVLLDLMLPDMDGLEVMKRSKAENKQFETPVVVMTEVDLDLVRQEV